MTKEQKQVKEFMLKAGQECPDKPTMPSLEVRKLRVKLIAEELLELCAAYHIQLDIMQDGEIEVFWNGDTGDIFNDLILAADATADLRVVVIGTDVAMGIDGEPCWNEVHRSNMSKFIDGHRREDGKWIKGPSYSPANLASIIEEQSK